MSGEWAIEEIVEGSRYFVVTVEGERAMLKPFYTPAICAECGFTMALEYEGDTSWKPTCQKCGDDCEDTAIPRSAERVLRGIAEAIFGCYWCENGEPCPRAVAECPFKFQSAIEAGIPRSVITGGRQVRR